MVAERSALPRGSFIPVTVTARGLDQFDDVKVSDVGETVAASVSELDTAMVTFAVGSLVSTTVKLSVPPFSSTVTAVGDTVTPALSSSVMVSVKTDGSATPLPPLAAPETVTVLSGASTALSTAVIVTTPVLVVAPAAIVSTLSELSVKSPDTAGLTAAADTVTSVPHSTARSASPSPWRHCRCRSR